MNWLAPGIAAERSALPLVPWRSPKRGYLRERAGAGVGGRAWAGVGGRAGVRAAPSGELRGAKLRAAAVLPRRDGGAPELVGVVLGEHVVVDARARAVLGRAARRAAGDGARRRARADGVPLEVRARDELALQVVRADLAGLPHRDLAGARRGARGRADERSGGDEEREHCCGRGSAVSCDVGVAQRSGATPGVGWRPVGAQAALSPG